MKRISLLVIALLLLVSLPASAVNYQEIVTTATVTAEIALTVGSNSLSMTGSIPGLTGGTADANTTYTVITNNAAGYAVSLVASSSGKMIGPTINSVNYEIPAYTGSGNAWTVGANTAAFGYSTTSTNWWGSNVSRTITTSPYPTVAAGTTTSLYFRTTITANPSPAIASGVYYATTSLTATML